MLSAVYWRYLHRAKAGVLMRALEPTKDGHVAEFNDDGMRDDERETVFGILEGIAAVALWVPFAEKLPSAVR